MQQMIFIADFIVCSTCFGHHYYTDGRCLWYLVLWSLSCWYGVELRVVCPVCGQQPANRTRNYLLIVALLLELYSSDRTVEFRYQKIPFL